MASEGEDWVAYDAVPAERNMRGGCMRRRRGSTSGTEGLCAAGGWYWSTCTIFGSGRCTCAHSDGAQAQMHKHACVAMHHDWALGASVRASEHTHQSGRSACCAACLWLCGAVSADAMYAIICMCMSYVCRRGAARAAFADE